MYYVSTLPSPAADAIHASTAGTDTVQGAPCCGWSCHHNLARISPTLLAWASLFVTCRWPQLTLRIEPQSPEPEPERDLASSDIPFPFLPECTETGSGQSGCPWAPQLNHRLRALGQDCFLELFGTVHTLAPRTLRPGGTSTCPCPCTVSSRSLSSSSSDRPVEVDAVVILTHVSHVWSPSGLVASRPHLSTTSHLLCWDDT